MGLDEAALAKIRRTAIESCDDVKLALAEGHIVHLVVLDPVFFIADCGSVGHRCRENGKTRRVILTTRAMQRYKHGMIEAAVRVLGGYCARCHAMIVGAAVVDQRMYRSRV